MGNKDHSCCPSERYTEKSQPTVDRVVIVTRKVKQIFVEYDKVQMVLAETMHLKVYPTGANIGRRPIYVQLHPFATMMQEHKKRWPCS